jgi:hypothetical protein
MAGPLPHSTQIQKLGEIFLNEVADEISKAQSKLKKSAEFRRIYRISLAADAVLSRLLRLSRRPPPHAARSIVKGVPLLVCARQLGPARIELRRFMELVVWEVYFREHPVEWEKFSSNPTHGFTRDEKDPIEYCAHRELEYYLNYAKSRVADEPSKVAGPAVEELRLLKGKLNEAVHPGAGAGTTGRVTPLDAIEEPTLREFSDLQRSVFKNACIVIASVRRNAFDRLPAMHRAHFDWLVGDQLAKRIRSGPFGL